jgi:pantothenate kinase
VDTLEKGKKYLLGVTGVPGSGKTTTSHHLNKMVNDARPGSSVIVPMDGFHLYRWELDKLENPKEAHDRRGAPYTFNPTKFADLLEKIRNTGAVKAPSFDHHVGDPVEEDIEIKTDHKLVIVEGIYLLLKDPEWQRARACLDEVWYVDIDVNAAMERVRKRHISTGLSAELAKERCDRNDGVNSVLIEANKKAADKLIVSQEDQKLALVLSE